MPYITKHGIALAELHAANWLKLWYAHLDIFHRYSQTLSEVMAPWRSHLKDPRSSPAREEDPDTAARRAELAVEELLRSWSRMYQAAVFHDAVNAMQPHATQSIQGGIGDRSGE